MQLHLQMILIYNNVLVLHNTKKYMVICLLKIIIFHYTLDFFFVVVITLYIITRDTPKINILQTQENYYDAHTKHHNMQNFMCKHPFFLETVSLYMPNLKPPFNVSYSKSFRHIVQNGLKINNRFSK